MGHQHRYHGNYYKIGLIQLKASINMQTFDKPAAAELSRWQRHARTAFPALCQPRAANSHKGSHGTLALVGGSTGMSGALVLAGSAALKSGCGKVWLGFMQTALPMPVLPQQPEIMLATAAALAQRPDINGWAVGCGMGTGTEAAAWLAALLRHTANRPLLLDADALNLLAVNPAWHDWLQQRHGDTLLTPHPAEAARLLQCGTDTVEANRPAAARQLAARFHAWVVLKGHHTLIASPSGQISQNHSGNPGLATAGSGDVLSGIIGSLLVQGIPTAQAATGGVWLHGAAADLLAANGCGPIGLTAGELADAVRWLRNRLTAEHSETTQQR